MTDIALLKTRLSEAQTAEHQLLTGKMVAQASTGGGQTVSYTKNDLPALQGYIDRLTNQIARAEGRPGRGPIRIVF